MRHKLLEILAIATGVCQKTTDKERLEAIARICSRGIK